jgi:phage portal protein BeeE
MPWLIMIKQAITRDLLTDDERDQGVFAEFNPTAFLRGDAAGRAAYYGARFAVGSITPNEIRAFENENPIPGGDEAFVQLNLTNLTTAGAAAPGTGGGVA